MLLPYTIASLAPSSSLFPFLALRLGNSIASLSFHCIFFIPVSHLAHNFIAVFFSSFFFFCFFLSSGYARKADVTLCLSASLAEPNENRKFKTMTLWVFFFSFLDIFCRPRCRELVLKVKWPRTTSKSKWKLDKRSVIYQNWVKLEHLFFFLYVADWLHVNKYILISSQYAFVGCSFSPYSVWSVSLAAEEIWR